MTDKGKKGIFYSILTITIVSFLSKIIGFVREGVIAAYFGTTADTDIFFLANSLYVALTTIIGSSIAIAYLPRFVKNEESEGKDSALRSTSVVVNQLLVISLFLTVIVFLLAPHLSRWMAPEYSAIQLTILSQYIRYLSLSLFFTIAVFILISVLNAQKKFGIPQLTGIIYSIVTIVMVVFFHSWGEVDVLLYSVITSAVIQFVVLFFLVFRSKSQLVLRLEFGNKKGIDLYRSAMVVFLGTGTLFISQFIDKVIAIPLKTGAVSALYYSGVLHSLVNTLLVIPLVTVFYTDISQKYAKNDLEGVISSWQKGFSLFTLLLVPLTILLFTNSNSIISILFERGKFTEESTLLTSSAFSFYVIGSVFFAIRNLSTRFFYVIGDVKTPMINGCVSVVLNALLAYMLSLRFGISGITLASAITAVIVCVWLVYRLNKKITLNLKSISPIIIKVAVASVVMYFGIIVTFNVIHIDIEILQLLISSLIGLSIYLSALLLLKCTEIKYIFSIIKMRLRK